MNADPFDAPATGEGLASGDFRIDAPGVAAVCATCHQPLVRQGDQGACVYCLVNFASDVDDDTFEEEADSHETLAGTIRRYGHFEILSHADGSSVELGRGAMGTTYRAKDTVLHRAVALKIIDRNAAQHPAARERFLREARAAAQFQHPNVATVSHYGEQEGQCYYAMELVEGETLEARVQRDGALPVALTLAITMQVTKALVAAEARGIIHRDLKPTNLMLTVPEGETDGGPLVKVIDFGLAKAVTEAAKVEGAFQTRGGFVGTPAFASPEQFDRPDETQIDHRSDIFSLGVTMWYSLCGQVPFSGRTLEAIHARQIESLPVAQLASRAVPRSVIGLLASMLAVDPADRPQSAQVLLDELRRCREKVGAHPRTSRRERMWRWTAALAGLMAFGIAVTLYWRHLHSDPEQGVGTIAVLPFENAGSDSGDAFYATGMQDEIIADLARIAALKVIGASSTRGYPPGKRDLAKIGQELGARHLLEGSVRRDGGMVRVRVRLVDTRDAIHPWVAEYERRLADVFIVQGEITRAIAEHLQTPVSDAERNAINEPPTTDLAAYDLYLRARETFNSSFDTPAELFAILAKVVSLLDEAVARDPNFVAAYCELASVHDTWHSYRVQATPEQRTVDHRALAEAALQKARRLRPDAGEVHLASAAHFFDANNDHDQARIEVDLARRTLPNNAKVEQLAARIDRTQGRWEDAIICLQRAIVLDPRDLTNRSALAQTYHLLRRWDDFSRASKVFISLLPPEEPSRYDPGPFIGLERDADLAPLRAYLAAVPPSRHSMSDDWNVIILPLFEHDADALSRTLATSNRAKYVITGVVYPKAWLEGLVARMRGDTISARNAFAAARVEAEKTVNADATDGLNLSMLAMIDAGLGRTDDAVSEGRRACEMLPETQWARRSPMAGSNLAVVYAWTGQPDLAIDKLQELVKKPSGEGIPIQPCYGDLKLNPVWDPLRGNPRFESLVKQMVPASPKGPPQKPRGLGE